MVDINASAGERVRIRLTQEEIDGVLLESPEPGIILLKLDSGYNVGIRKENILGSRILPIREKGTVLNEIKQDMKLPCIGMIVTGGTIASKVSQSTGGVRPVTDANEFLSFYPGLMKLVRIKKIEIPFKVFSENMDSSHWVKMAEAAEKMLNDDEIKGIIISHGTDTLHYTAAALSFFLRNLNKPVVLTYSQRSIDRASSDADLNLRCAARMALSDCAEVVLVGHATTNDDYCYALRGTKVKKLHSSRRDAFKPVNCGPIARVYPDRVEFISSYKKRHDRRCEIDAEFSDKVALVKYYPGQSPSILDYYSLKYKGIIIEGTGLGHVGESWIPALKKHIKAGLVVCVAGQTVNGRLDGYVYSTGRELMDAGVIYLEDMLAETAFVKLGWVLAHYGWKKNVKEKMLENFAGELNERLIE